VCKDSGLGDALSTALFCMDKEKGLSLVESMPDVEALWVLDDGSKSASSGWNKYVIKQ
jgi:thiamine biosynthesis lipoprotein